MQHNEQREIILLDSPPEKNNTEYQVEDRRGSHPEEDRARSSRRVRWEERDRRRSQGSDVLVGRQ